MSLKDRLDEDPAAVEAWRPNPGEELIGTIIRISERKTEEYADPYPIITIKPDDGDALAFHAFHTVARGQIEEQAPQVGDEIGVRYMGEEKGSRYSYHNYRIVIEAHRRPVAEEESIAATQEAHQKERDQQADEEVPF